MFSTPVIASTVLVIFYSYWRLRALRQRISEAKNSGLPYTVSPVFFQEIWWMVLQQPLLPILQLLPRAWTESWLPLSLFGRIWHAGYGPFAKKGSDTFIMVSPGGNILWTCEPEAILQFTKRHHDFVKPVEMMGMLNMFGPTITATEGEESRLYRKIASPSFNDRTHNSAWIESLDQTAAMLRTWNSMRGLITQLNEDVAKLTLHVISHVCFDRKIDWRENTGYQHNAPEGHSMSYREAIGSMLDNTGTLFMTPPPVLKISPLELHKKAKTSFIEWRRYMEEMRDETQEKLRQNKPRKNASILESFVQAGQTSPTDSNAPAISPTAVLGNMFIFIIAGHETSANTLTYAILLLACRPDIQKMLQTDLDRIFGDRPSSQWSFEADFPQVLDGYIGAVMNETLRLYSVLPFLPKTTGMTPKSLTLDNRNYTIPANTLIMINTSATHRNPKYWPSAVPIAGDGPPYPVSSFDPSRWVEGNPSEAAGKSPFSPESGSYVPFAEGPRACIGKRFAQAEFCGVMATIFKDYSVELIVDDDGQRVDKGSRRSLWEKAKWNAEQELSTGVGFLLSLKMNGKVPLRLVKRGEEQEIF